MPWFIINTHALITIVDAKSTFQETKKKKKIHTLGQSHKIKRNCCKNQNKQKKTTSDVSERERKKEEKKPPPPPHQPLRLVMACCCCCAVVVHKNWQLRPLRRRRIKSLSLGGLRPNTRPEYWGLLLPPPPLVRSFESG